MEQTKIERALKRLWKEYIKEKMKSAVEYGTRDSVEELRLRLDKIMETNEIVDYVEKEINVK